MRIAFNPSTVAALTTPPNNKDITFDLRGRNIFARGVKFQGTDTNTWRPVVDSLTSDSTTSSLSAKQGKILAGLINNKSDSGHNHDDRYIKKVGGIPTSAYDLIITPTNLSGDGYVDVGGGIHVKAHTGTPFQLWLHDTSNVWYKKTGDGAWKKMNAGYADIAGSVAWANVTGKPSSYTPSAHTHAWNSLTHSSTTANQAILTNGSVNGWKLYTLNISAWDNAANNVHSHSNKAILDGITSALVSSWNTAYNFVDKITKADTDKVINKWDEIVNFLAGIDSNNKLNTLLNSKLSIQQLAANDILTTKTNNALFWVNTVGTAGNIPTGPFTDHPYALLSVTNYSQNDTNGKFFYRSRLAFSSIGDIKVASCHHQNEYKQDETWYNVLTSKNSGINGSTIKLNGTSITVYSSGTADGRYVKKSGDTMSGALNFANGTWNLVGDDSYMGDCNISGHFGVKAANTTYPGIAFFNNANTYLGKLTAYSGNIKYGSYSLQFLDNGNTSVSASTWTNPFSAYDENAVENGQAICVWGQSSYLSNLSTGTGDMTLWLKRVNANVASLNMVLDGEYYASGNQRLAHVSEIPSSLKNPYALTISLNGTSQGPYDGSAAKSINITAASIGAATSGHNHDERYLALSGGWMTGDINFGRDSRICWARNTDSASISFKNDGDADYDSYMSFVTSDNGNEYFRWSHNSASTNTEWMSLKGDGLRVRGTKVSLEGHTHDDRYLKLTGGTMTGTIYRRSGGATISGRDNAIIRQTYAPGGSSWNPIACVDTETGTWTLGHLSQGSSNTDFSFCFSTNADYNAGNNNGNYVFLRNKAGIIALTSEIPNKNSWNYDDRYYTKAESNAKYITDISTSVNKLTFTKNGSNIDRTITVNNVQSQGQLTNIADQDNTTKADSGLYIYDSYYQIIGTNHYSSVLSIHTGGTIQIAGNWGDDETRNLYWRSQSDRDVTNYPWKSWRTILDSENYSSTLDSRYYTESEVNSLLSNKLNTSNFNWTNLPGKIVAGNEFNIVNAGFKEGIWFNYLPINDRSNPATINSYHFGNGNKGYTYIVASGFIKNGSNSSYVLLGDGGHQTISSLSVNYANSSGSASHLEGGGIPGWGTLTAANGFTNVSSWDYGSRGAYGLCGKSGILCMQLDGYFYQNEGQYRVLDTSDVAGLKGDLTIHQYLSATDATWWPLIWGGSSHNNTSDYTGAVYKSHDKLSWQTSSQTLYATNLYTGQLKTVGNHYYQFNSDATLRIYGSPSSTAQERVYLQAGIDNRLDDYDIPSYGGDQRHSIILNPRGGFVGIGDSNPAHKLSVAGNIRVTGQIIREGSSQTWVNGRNGALLRETSVSGYHALWSLKTTNGSWDFGEYNAGSGWNNVPVLSYITDSNYNSGNNTLTHQIRFPLDSGTVALTKNIPTSLPANGGNADTVDNEHASNFSYTHQSSFDFTTSKNGRIVTFDQSSTAYGWINGFASTHYNYLTSVIFNTHRTSNWYVGYIEGDHSTGKTQGLQAVRQLAFTNSNVTSATKLQTARKIWGQSFDGTNDITGVMTINPSTISDGTDNTFMFKVYSSTGFKNGLAISSTDNVTRLYAKPFGGGAINRLEIHTYNNADVNAVTISASGNVGIGTTPGYKLDVRGSIYSSEYIRAYNGFVKTNSSDNYVLLGGGGHKALSDFASSSHNHDGRYAISENYGGFTRTGRLPISGFYQSYESTSGGNAPWTSWMHLINCQHNNTDNNYALQIAASFYDNNTFKIRVTNDNVNNAWRDIIHSGNIGAQSVNYANSAGNADKVDGYHATDGRTFNGYINWGSWNDAWSDGTHAHPWYGFDHRYPNTGAYSTTITDYFGMTIKTANTLRLDFSTLLLNGTSIYDINVASATNAYHLRINSANSWSTWNWSGQGGQPTWLWGSNDGTNMYVWNPSNFSVNYANSAGSATKVIVNQHTASDINYPLVWSNQPNTNGATENQLFKSWADLYYNPKNKRLCVAGSAIIGASAVPSYTLDVRGNIIADTWLRTRGEGGWYSESYGGGIWMWDTSWIRTYGNKGFYCDRQIYSSNSIRMSDIYLQNTNEINNGANGILYLNYRNTGNVSLGNGGGCTIVGPYTAGDTGNNKLFVNGSEFIDGASNVRNHVYADGFRHRSHNSNDSVLLAGGGYSQGVPVRYWAIYSVYIGNSSTDVTYTRRSGNYSFISDKSYEVEGVAIFEINFPSGYNKNNTLIFGNGDHRTSSDWRTPVYVTITTHNGFGSNTNIRVMIADDYSFNAGFANIYFMCMG